MRDDLIKEKRRISRIWKGVWILGIILLSGIVILAGYRSFRRFLSGTSRDFMQPFLNSVVKTQDKAAASILVLQPKWQLASQLAALSREKTKIDAENAQLKAAEAENIRLKELLNIPRSTKFAPVFAEIITRAIPTWREQFVINRGEKDGISPGNLVIASDLNGIPAVVGRIKEVSRHTALVVTLFSKECRLSVMLENSHLCGGMEAGDSGHRLMIRYLPADGTYAEKETVVTSGISSQTPAGIRIGSIIKNALGNVAVVRDQMFAEAEIAPFIKIDSVRFVAVYTRNLPK